MWGRTCAHLIHVKILMVAGISLVPSQPKAHNRSVGSASWVCLPRCLVSCLESKLGSQHEVNALIKKKKPEKNGISSFPRYSFPGAACNC